MAVTKFTKPGDHLLAELCKYLNIVDVIFKSCPLPSSLFRLPAYCMRRSNKREGFPWEAEWRKRKEGKVACLLSGCVMLHRESQGRRNRLAMFWLSLGFSLAGFSANVSPMRRFSLRWNFTTAYSIIFKSSLALQNEWNNWSCPLLIIDYFSRD